MFIYLTVCSLFALHLQTLSVLKAFSTSMQICVYRQKYIIYTNLYTHADFYKEYDWIRICINGSPLNKYVYTLETLTNTHT